MCRLYALHANEPTRVECSLVRSQNALMAQSASDSDGMVHGHGWGVAEYTDGLPMIEKNVWAAFHGERFSKAAARVYARTVMAHVRRATVGETAIENTHPFHHGPWIFAHNGTVPGFEEVRMRLLEHIDPLHRSEISGTTDSEQVFRYLLSLILRHPDWPLLDIARTCVLNVVEWAKEAASGKKVGLNFVLTDGQRMVGARLNRSLYYLKRDQVFVCPICKRSHVHHKAQTKYHAVEIASEPFSEFDRWHEVPDRSVFEVDEDYYLNISSLHSKTRKWRTQT